MAAPDLEAAAALVLAPRARVLPTEEGSDPEPRRSDEDASEGPSPPDPSSEGAEPSAEAEASPASADMLVEAVRTALPPGLLAALEAGRTGGAPASAARAGAGARRVGPRGRPLPSRPGRPSRGRIDAAATLRAAAPWQRMRRAARDAGGPAAESGSAPAPSASAPDGRPWIDGRRDAWRACPARVRDPRLSSCGPPTSA